MFKVYIFTYKGVNKQLVTETIKGVSAWYRFDDSSFILCSQLTVEQLNNTIVSFIDVEKDKYLFLEIDIKHYKGRLSSDIWDWLKKQIAKTK
jgi:hypothetical protein